MGEKRKKKKKKRVVKRFRKFTCTIASGANKAMVP